MFDCLLSVWCVVR